MNHFIDLTLNGIANGAIYAALGLSLVIIYQATRVVNFAQPALALIAVYLAYAVYLATGSYWTGFAVALASGTLMGVLAERLLIRPVHGRSPLSAIIVTLGLLLALQGAAGMVWGNGDYSFPYPMDFRGRFSPAGAFGLGAVAVVTLLLFALYRFTPLGLRMRAAALHPESARLSGVRVGLMLTAGWGIASAIGALAGMLAAPPFLSPNALDAVFVYGIAAAVLGGLESPFGAVAGGLLLGVGLSYVSGYAGPELTTLAALAILVVVLSVRPDGLFTRPVARKV
ncbi:branched-chain amino acid ABC transporter permease [Actinorugispora endophytica]|uniref:Amino acid/amide ABC transporter membrane protein 1 (HAAT family) n=1 Tax=Actinorugispora endophytica TaxID=1605990 RepID=A0A4R6UKA2_9ACTN|nr:branched-chain amino acid ABC transporter permease [Actinorugispora endophytica]TDQ45743.1 amino acid/amide ABC transporter membrane protein 1 (HAAT family) [Actinorugispora endophytica]